MKLITWAEDKKTGISIGVNAIGELFLGNDKAGFNLKDINANRVRLEKEVYIKYNNRRLSHD